MLSFRSFCFRLYPSALAILCLMAGIESLQQWRDSRFVASVAESVVETRGARTPREKILALRDFLRGHVTFEGAPKEQRPFLRATAGEVLSSRLGYCGEVTRTFICMAAAVGVRAQRINLWGSSPHVVAEAEIAPGQTVIVGCQNPPQIAELERLDRVILRPEYEDYYSLNVRRLGLSGVVSRLKLKMGPLTYWTENPHALKAALYLLLGALLVAARLLRRLARAWLRRRGWVRRSEIDGLQSVVAAEPPVPR